MFQRVSGAFQVVAGKFKGILMVFRGAPREFQGRSRGFRWYLEVSGGFMGASRDLRSVLGAPREFQALRRKVLIYHYRRNAFTVMSNVAYYHHKLHSGYIRFMNTYCLT